MNELYLDESVILLNLECTAMEDVLTKMGCNLVDKSLVKDGFVKAVIEREDEFATGLPTAGVSVAIPHTDVEHVNKNAISIGVLKNAVDFGVMGDDSKTTPVKIVFMLAIDQPHTQLTLLQKLMQVFQNQDTLNYLVSEKDKTSIKYLLEKKLDFNLTKGDEYT